MKTTKAEATFLDAAAERLGVICDALALPEPRAHELFSILEACLAPWARRPVGANPAILSDITDDHSPFEFSIAFRGKGAVDVRLLFEALPHDPRVSARWAAGEKLADIVAAKYGASLAGLRSVSDLFRPDDEWARFALWFAVNVGADASFKVYMNPAARGPHRASAVVKEALARLGIVDAFFPELRRGFDAVKYFSLDLDDKRDGSARVKVYFSHRNADAGFIERMLSSSPSYTPGDAARFCAALSGDIEVFDALPLQSCYSYVGGALHDVALHFPVRSYVVNDDVARQRIEALLDPSDRSTYRRVVDRLAGGSARTSTGMQTYASFWAKRGIHLPTIYFAPQLYGRVFTAAEEARPYV